MHAYYDLIRANKSANGIIQILILIEIDILFDRKTCIVNIWVWFFRNSSRHLMMIGTTRQYWYINYKMFLFGYSGTTSDDCESS